MDVSHSDANRLANVNLRYLKIQNGRQPPFQNALIIIWDTWTKLVSIGNIEARNGYYVTNDVGVGQRSFCSHYTLLPPQT